MSSPQYLNPSLIANSVPQPQSVQPALSMADQIQKVQQLQQQNQQQAALAPIAQQQAQANVQGSQLANQQTQQQISDNQAFARAMRDSGGDPDKLEAAVNANITDPTVVARAEGVISQIRQRNASTTDQQYKIQAAQNKQIMAGLQAALDSKDDATYNNLIQGVVTSASTMKRPDGTPVLPPGMTGGQISRDFAQHVLTYLDANSEFSQNQAKSLTDKANAQKAQAAADNESFASAVQSMPSDVSDPDIQAKWTAWRNSLPASKQSGVPTTFSPSAVANTKLSMVPTEQQPDYQLKARQAAAASSMNPQTVEQSIAATINPAEHPQDFKDALNRATASLKGGTLSQNALDGIVKDYTDRYAGERSRVSEATNPAILKAEIGKALAINKAERQGSNPDLANVAPDAVSKVTSDAVKLDQDYAKAKNATESLGKLLDLADQGNAVAGASIAGTGAGVLNAINGIKRINPKSVEDYGDAGSVWQGVVGKLDKWGGRGPMPASLRDEVRDLHQDLGQQAYKTYTDNLNSINARSGASLKPTLAAPNIRKTGKITVTDPSGGVHTFLDQASADKFKKLANIQ